MSLTSEQELALLALLDNYTSNKKTISDLESAVEAEADQLLPIEKAGATKNISVDDIRAFVEENFSLFATTSTSGTSLLRSPITIANNVSDANNDIDFSAGTFQFDDGSGQAAAIAMTKRLDAAWAAGTNQGGLFSGSKANSTWYSCWKIYNPTTGVEDSGFDVSPTGANIPAGYTKKERRGFIRTDNSGNILPFTQSGKYFEWKVPFFDINVTNPGTSANLRTLSIPFGIKTYPQIVASPLLNAGGGASYYLITSPDQTDSTPSSSLFDIQVADETAETSSISKRVTSNTSSQIRTRFSLSGVAVYERIFTQGWIDYQLN